MPLTTYPQFILANRRFLAFGFVMSFASSAGQTYFIGAFSPAIRAEFSLSHASWGAIYMAGTLCSAAFLPMTGRWIDTVPLPRYSAGVLAGLLCACLFMSWVPIATLLIPAVFFLRQTGQGLSSHVSSTAMAQHFHHDRGKAVAVASLGFACGEALLPVLAVLSISAIGWRATYLIAAVLMAVIILPAALILLRGHGRARSPEPLRPAGNVDGVAGGWTQRQVLKDPRFYILLPALLAPSVISTALFFHHLELAASKGWSALWITGNYWIFALGSVAAALGAGPLIDRISAQRVLPGFLLPTVVGLGIVWLFDDPRWALLYLFCIGLTGGIAYTAVTTLWAEVYGVDNLGAIRALFVALSVFSSALGPVLFGSLLDGGMSVENIVALFALYCLAATGILVVGLRRFRADPSAIEPH